MYSNNGLQNATLFDPTSKADLGKGLVQDGFIIVEKRPGRRFAKIVSIDFFVEFLRLIATVLRQNLHNLTVI